MINPVRLRLDIAYDGTDFSGWARQPGLRTVQETLEHWVRTVLRLDDPVQLTCAGRTDAGVHARGQVAHLDVDPAQVERPRHTTRTAAGGDQDIASLLQRRLARALPADIAVRDVSYAPEGFDARFAAIWRRYVYRISDQRSTPDPLLRTTTAAINSTLDETMINNAVFPLLGLHDFAAFCKRRDGSTTIRTLNHCYVNRIEEGERAGTVEIEVQADAFCHSMVRSLVGALVAVGSGRRSASWLAELVNQTERSGDIAVMPAHGLTLEEVGYPDDDALADRVDEARATRELP